MFIMTHQALISYLRDNRSQILEVWLTEVELDPPKGTCVEHGGLPVIYLEHIFDATLSLLGSQKSAPVTAFSNLSNYLGKTLDCHTNNSQSLACFEILTAGYKAFASILNPEWDCAGEFTEDEHDFYNNLVKKALTATMHFEIQKCAECAQKSDCPFNHHAA